MEETKMKNKMMNALSELGFTGEETIAVKNGVKRPAIRVIIPNMNVSPIIYCDEPLETFDKEEFKKNILDAVKNVQKQAEVYDVGEKLQDKDFLKENLFVRVMNKDKKENLTEELVFDIPNTDWIGVCSVHCSVSSDNGTATPKKEFLSNILCMEDEAIVRLAIDNSRNEICVRPMSEVIAELIGDDFSAPTPDKPMYVATNKSEVYGIGGILKTDFLKEVSKRFFDGKDFILFPSSVHECIFVPAEGMTKEYATETVLFGNATCEPDIILDDKAYIVKNGEIFRFE